MAPERAPGWPWHRRLAARYAATLASVGLGSALLVATPLYLAASNLLEAALDERLEGIAELSALSLESTDASTTTQTARLEVLCEEADLDTMYLVDSHGTVVASTGDARPTLTDLDRAALAAAATADATTTPVQLDVGGARFLTAYAPVDGAQLLLGVRAAAPYLERLDNLRSVFFGGALLLGLLVAVLGGLGGARLTRPIRRLLDATERLAAGQTPLPPEPGGAAELDSLQEAFAKMVAAVQERERRLRALAGAVAHEVRNPSNALRLHLGLLRRDLGPAEAHAARVRTLERELDALDATVDGFLVFAHDRRARCTVTDLRSLLTAAAEGAPVSCPDIDINVDPLLVGRAVNNLVRNAREAGAAAVHVRGQVAEANLEIEVEDDGPGFPHALRLNAFEPFVSGRVGGSGLGLAIVAAVARAHDGVAFVVVTGPGRTLLRLQIPLPG